MSEVRIVEETLCEHGNWGVCDHLPAESGWGACLRLDCRVTHHVPCPGGSRRVLRETQPDYREALAVLRYARPQWTEFVGDPFVSENVVDAALAGRRIVEETE